jgi:hypothetical protein
MTRSDQNHPGVGQVRQCGSQHAVGADGIDRERVEPRRHIGVLDVGEGHHSAGEHYGVDTVESFGSRADDGADGRRILHVEFERRSTDAIGEFGQ